MNELYHYILSVFLIASCSPKQTKTSKTSVNQFTTVSIEEVMLDSVSIRAITTNDNELFYAGSQGKFGSIKWDKDFKKITIHKGTIVFQDKSINFRAVGENDSHYFLLSIDSPALLYKVDKKSMLSRLVYREEGENVFYDALLCSDTKNAIAIGDPTNTCMSVILTKDGGDNWSKVDCSNLPKVNEGEAAFAASNGNIAQYENKIWFVSGGRVSRIYISENGGESWTSTLLPIVQGTSTTGAYALDFYDELIGIAYGGDYTKPEKNTNNIVMTYDGGKSWKVKGNGSNDGYKSAVQFIPKAGGRGIVATGFTGISLSNDGGETWSSISKEGFYTFRFVNDSIAFAAGKNRIAKLTFR